MTDVAAPGAPAELPALYASGRRKQRRARYLRIASYVVAVTVVVATLAFADWSRIGEQFFNIDVARDQFPDIITIAAKNTILYTAMAYVGGVVLGVGIALLRLSRVRAYRGFALTYIEVLRGLPALVTILLIAFVIPVATGVSWPKPLGLNGGGVLALALVAGAYMAETVRAGIEAVARGQGEAARSLGMTAMQTTRSVVIPQAFRIVIPPLTNELVLLIKDTSLLAILGATPTSKELLKFGQDVSGQTFNGTAIVLAGGIYLLITLPLTWFARRLERRTRAYR
jgi:polar amino acid transport system permease protein